MSEYLYFIFQIHNPNIKLIREFKNVIQTDEQTIKQELHKLNIPFSKDIPFTIEKIKMPVNTTFDYLFRPVISGGHFVTYFEARRMEIDLS